MFQEESRTVQVNGKAVSGDYQYNVNYSVNNDDLSRYPYRQAARNHATVYRVFAVRIRQ